MNCPDCAHDNRSGVKCCTKCGSPLFLFCPTCRSAAVDGDVFCGECGVKLPQMVSRPQLEQPEVTSSPTAVALTPPDPTANGTESARKHVTVLFADISGFTAMSEKLDPEEVTDLMNGCLTRLAETVTKYEGHVDKFVGDCIMALFGAPIAHENDPELALRCALEMNQVTEEYNKTLPIKLEKPLMLHTGINSGMVVAGGVGTGENMAYTVMGDTVNLASRLESIAGNGQIFISKYTHNLVRNKFSFTELEPIKVKGKKDPVAVYEVMGLKTTKTQEPADQKAKTPLIGRSREMKTLHDRIDRFLDGDSEIVLLTSDAGIGKSRVQLEIETYLADKQVQIIQGTCHSFSRSTGYYVFSEIIKNLMDIDSADLPDTMSEKLSTNLPLVTGVDPEVLPDEAREAIVFLGSILGLNLGEDYDISIEQMDSQDVMMSIFRSIRWFFERLAASKPLILILEDLHYADNISIDVLHYLFEGLPKNQIMMLLLLRPEKGHPSENLGLIAERQLGSQCTELVFDRLKPQESDELVKSLLHRDDVPDPILTMVRSRADGNPFYIEAIVRDLGDNQVIEMNEDHPIKILKNLDDVEIPDTIQGMIVSRIDRLPSDLKDVLQAASVIGPVFKLELARRVLNAQHVLNDDLLDEKLNRLYTMDMLYESKTFPEIEFSFKNMLIQEAAYSCLLLKRQRELHRVVATAIEDLYADRLEDYYENLAMHYANAQDYEQAYTYAVQSGRKAQRVFANKNAIEHFNTALEVVEHIETPEPPLADVYTWMSEIYELTGELDAAIDALRKAIGQFDDDLAKADAHRNIGRIFEKQGKKDEALSVYHEVLEELAAYPESLEMAWLLMNESWVLNRNRAHKEAIEKCSQSLELFEKHEDAEGIGQAHNNLAVFYESEQELDRALEHNLKSMKVFSDLNNKRKLANVYLSVGYVYDKRNERDTALDYFEDSIATMERIGNLYGTGTALMAKGRCYMDMGRLEEAESVLIRSLKIHKELGLNLKIIANELALARVHMSKSDFEATQTYLDDAKAIAEANDNKSDLAKVTHLEAMAMARKGEDPSAKYEQAISMFETLGRDRDVQRVKADLDTYRELITQDHEESIV